MTREKLNPLQKEALILTLRVLTPLKYISAAATNNAFSLRW